MNNRKRKLAKIRQRNKIRVYGGTFNSSFKVSDQIVKTAVDMLVHEEVPKTIKELERKWKQPFKLVDTVIGWHGFDIANELATVVFKFRCYGYQVKIQKLIAA